MNRFVISRSKRMFTASLVSKQTVTNAIRVRWQAISSPELSLLLSRGRCLLLMTKRAVTSWNEIREFTKNDDGDRNQNGEKAIGLK